ncbi:hypothetical protein [Psychromonas antarctica]|uniref:hypothetical protein n=1 Tax=Psychromonas antarctica TaxID=67573 RepID=UPI001EE92793|nr:hypothetical protein [Psychromonas antarctica]MCG6202198.1 hypothetical protein [Psychromonas antarctica]
MLQTGSQAEKLFCFGKRQRSVFFGLPDNQVSAMVTLYQLAVTLMFTIGGVK